VPSERNGGKSAFTLDCKALKRRPRPRMTRERRSAVVTRTQVSSGDRGTGAVKATGFYEGSLSTEGISGRHESSPFTSRWSRRPWRLFHAESKNAISAQEKEATEVSEARSVRWRRGKITPTLQAHGASQDGSYAKRHNGNACPATIRRSVHECRETLGPSVNPTEPKTSWGIHAVKVA